MSVNKTQLVLKISILGAHYISHGNTFFMGLSFTQWWNLNMQQPNIIHMPCWKVILQCIFQQLRNSHIRNVQSYSKPPTRFGHLSLPEDARKRPKRIRVVLYNCIILYLTVVQLLE
jgi:hypothetical protein